MAREGVCVLVRFFALQGHRRGRELDRFADSNVAGFAAVHDVGIRHVDLENLRHPGFGLVLQTGHLRRRQSHHVVGDVSIQQIFLLVDRFDEIRKLRAQRSALVLQVVIGFFELSEVIGLLAAIGIFDAGDFLLVVVEVLLFAGFRGLASLGLDAIGHGVDVGAAIGEYVLHGQDFGAQLVQLFVDFLDTRRGLLAGAFIGFLERLVVRAGLHFLLRIAGLRAGILEEGGVTALPLVLKSLPGALAEVLVP